MSVLPLIIGNDGAGWHGNDMTFHRTSEGRQLCRVSLKSQKRKSSLQTGGRERGERCTQPTTAWYTVTTTKGGFKGRPLVQWPTRPMGGCRALEAPGPRGPWKAKFWLAIAKS